MKNRKNIDKALIKRWQEDEEFPDSGDEGSKDNGRLTVNNPSLQPGGWKPDPADKKKDHVSDAKELFEKGKLFRYVPADRPLPEKGHWDQHFQVYNWHKSKKTSLPKLL